MQRATENIVFLWPSLILLPLPEYKIILRFTAAFYNSIVFRFRQINARPGSIPTVQAFFGEN
jgi:hypothetical protein